MATPPFYNTAPLGLLLYDIRLVFALLLFLPGIIFPLSPFLSAELDELFPSSANLTAIFFHLLYFIAQIAFLIFLFFFVFWARARFVIAYVAVFLLINYILCNLTLNGRDRFITSDVDISSFPRHDNERWIFINGVAIGQHWLRSNVNLLSKTFGREILGVHNPTYGILFDVFQSLIERDFLYNTQDTRDGYVLVKSALKDPRYDKVVLILHSQGGIQGSLIVDMLLADLPEEAIHKLEVYTFAAAANHFNNPTRTVDGSQEYLIRHIEHYANSGDFVSRLGVLNFARAPAHLTNHFIGWLFERPGSGHMLNQHYLDTMFSLDPETGRVAATNEFMEMLVDEDAVQGGQNVPEIDAKLAVALREDSGSAVTQSPLPPSSSASGNMKPVSELSRLWKYRNGMSPTS